METLAKDFEVPFICSFLLKTLNRRTFFDTLNENRGKKRKRHKKVLRYL